MSLVREAGTTSIAQFTIPFKGTWNSIAANMVAPDALFDSYNVFIREGRLRNRPGLSLLNNTVFNSPIIGGDMAVTPTDKVLLAINKSRVYTLSLSDTAWQLDTAITIANDDHTNIDITFLETANEYVAVIASPGYKLKKWIQGQGVSEIVVPDSAIDTHKDVPKAKSVCTADKRIIALVDPHTLRWTQINRYDDWPALAYAKVSQSNDTGICVKPLSTLDFAIYKERSIYVAKAQAGTDAQAFNIQFSQAIEGPAGVHAVVEVEGAHMYMTKNGRVGLFDGTSKVQWVADGIWLYLQQQIDPAYADKIFGWYDYRLHTVMFVYPQQDSHGLMMGLVIINLPLQGSGIEPVDLYKRYIATPFLGQLSIPATFAYEKRFNNQIDASVVFTNEDETIHSCIWDETSVLDLKTLFDCRIQTALSPLPDMKHYQISVESLFERQNGYGQVTVQVVTSDMLESHGGTISQIYEQVIDLNNNKVQEYFGANIPTRFFGLRYTWTSADTVRWCGSAVYGRPVTT